ncbi:esterase [Streptomyces roseolus]|uniref:esterase n=1 Tax=Streptomyces roseolus TaxID=67358 RepID=UPI00365A260C
MPDGVRGALVQRVSRRYDGPLDITWLPAEAPKLALGRIRLHWEPASRAGWNVSAHLGLATTEVHLASWPSAPDNWPRLIRPTLYEVTGLCSALAFATAALDLSNRLAEVWPSTTEGRLSPIR